MYSHFRCAVSLFQQRFQYFAQLAVNVRHYRALPERGAGDHRRMPIL